jgi:hypothetical protein
LYCSAPCRCAALRVDKLARFWARVDKASSQRGCWLWTGASTKGGYGQFSWDRVPKLTHRTSWELAHGPIPEGMLVCHTCDVRNCLNPAHLFLGTQLQNIADKVAKGRQSRGPKHGQSRGNPARGEQHPNARLTAETVRYIRERYSTNLVSHADLALELGVSRATVAQVVRGVTWRHVV